MKICMWMSSGNMALTTLPPSHSSALRMISAGMAANTALMKNIIRCPNEHLETGNGRSAGLDRRLLLAGVGSPEIVRQSGGARLGLALAGGALARLALSPQCSWKILCTLLRHEREFDAGHAGSLLESAALLARDGRLQQPCIVKLLPTVKRLPP